MTFEAARDPRRTIEPTEIEALLPWYAVGTLPRRDRQRVEDALRHDPALSRHAELVREELAETICLNESLGAPSAYAMDRLMASIDDEEMAADEPNLPRAISGRFAAFMSSFSSRTFAAVAAVAVLAIAVPGVMLVDVINKPAATYQTASVTHVQRGLGTFAMVRFAREASAAEITRFLEKYQAAVVDGPKPGGLYRVRLAVSILARDEYARIVDRMRQDRIVESAEPTE
jgi:anti-sigma-K factor RskA